MKAVFLAILVGIVVCQAQKPWEPVPRPEQSWLDRHESFIQTSINNGSDIDIVFLGSSSIDNWDSTGKPLWDSKYVPLKSVNYGIGGDRIENCLWRIMNGELDNLNPKMFILYCGSNNIRHPSSDEIIQGVTVTLEEIARRLPQTRILYVTFNPRGDVTPVVENFDKTVYINQQVTDWADGNRTVVFDMFDDLVESYEEGKIKEYLYMQDKLHLNAPGYVFWDSLWNQTFFDTLNGWNK